MSRWPGVVWGCRCISCMAARNNPLTSDQNPVQSVPDPPHPPTEEVRNMLYIEVGHGDEKNVTVIVPGEMPMVAHSSHPNYARIVAKVKAGEYEGIRDLVDASAAAAAKFERLSERVTVSNGIVYLDGDEVHTTLTRQILRFIEEGVEDWEPLVKFFENVQANPTEHSREQLFDWLNARAFTITPEGNIVGYKGVQTKGGEYHSINSGRAIVNGEVVEGTIPNPIGAVVEMPRSEVAHNPGVSCSTGLHVATRNYATGWSHNGCVLEVHVNPRDVVSVPTDGGGEKVRVCRYTVVGVSDEERTSAYIAPTSVSLYNDEDEDEEMCDCGMRDADDCYSFDCEG